MIKNNLFFPIIYLIICFVQLSAQTDLYRWEKVDNYLLNSHHYDFPQNKLSDLVNDNSLKNINIANYFIEFYKATFSNFDGDNCRFSPSCSEFLVESTKLTHPIFSVLLFFDRLTRDTNFFSDNKYKIVNNRFYDPPSDYIFYSTNQVQ